MLNRAFLAIALAVLSLSTRVHAAPAGEWDAGEWNFDPSVLAASGSDLLKRAPPPQMDAVFQAVHAVAANAAEAHALCALLQPDADRSLDGLNTFASRLGPDSRARFGNALADLLVTAVQSAPQSYDPAAAQQSLKASAVTAALLHDGFMAGFQADNTDKGRDARCQSVRWLLDAMQSRPQLERASMTRLLLDQGLALASR